MDKLTKESQQHGEIFESMTFFKKSSEAFVNTEPPNYIEKLQKFIDEYIISHFEFEEKELFPTILKNGDLKEKHLIRELQIEHIHTLDKIEKFKDFTSSYGCQLKEEQVKEITEQSRGLIEMILQHLLLF